jgi:hypothetical protein
MSERRSPAKTVAMILGGLVALALVCGGGGLFFAKRWAESALEDMAGQAEQTQAEATAFGGGHSQAECQAESMRRGPDTCTDIDVGCMVDAAVFLHTCLQVAPADPATCEGVPSRDTPLEAGTWIAEECARRGYANRQPCNQVLQNGLLRYCDETR